jgi:hypothetical protein
MVIRRQMAGAWMKNDPRSVPQMDIAFKQSGRLACIGKGNIPAPYGS